MQMHNLVSMVQGQINLFEASTNSVRFEFDNRGDDEIILSCPVMTA